MGQLCTTERDDIVLVIALLGLTAHKLWKNFCKIVNNNSIHC